MVYNATTFLYNRATPRVPLYRGYIGRVKDRCVSDTCVFLLLFLVSSYDTHFTSENPCPTVEQVFREDQRSKYSVTAEHGSSEDFRRVRVGTSCGRRENVVRPDWPIDMS